MLKLPPGTRIFMAVAPVDMRRSFSGLCAIITETLGANPILCDEFEYVTADGKHTAKGLIALTSCVQSATHNGYRFSSRLSTASLGRYRGAELPRIPAFSRPRRIISTSAAA